MELKITSQKEQNLLSRKEILADLSFDAAVPSRNELKKEIALKIGIPENLIIIRKIENDYGYKKAKVLAYAYEKEEDLKRIESRAALEKGMPKQKKAAAKSGA